MIEVYKCPACNASISKADSEMIVCNHCKGVFRKEELLVGSASGLVGTQCGDYDVMLVSFGDSKMPVIKSVKEITQYGLKESLELVESVPCIIKTAVIYDEAIMIKSKIEAAGGLVQLNIAETYNDSMYSKDAPDMSCDDYDVVLLSYGNNKMPVIKAVKEATRYSLKDSKDLVESAPCTIKTAASREEALIIKSHIEAAGAVVEIS